jgi:hypothetical protein
MHPFYELWQHAISKSFITTLRTPMLGSYQVRLNDDSKVDSSSLSLTITSSLTKFRATNWCLKHHISTRPLTFQSNQSNKRIKWWQSQNSDLAAELLLQLPDEPDVDLLEGLAQPVGHVDHHRLPAPCNVHLAATTALQHQQQPHRPPLRWKLTKGKATWPLTRQSWCKDPWGRSWAPGSHSPGQRTPAKHAANSIRAKPGKISGQRLWRRRRRCEESARVYLRHGVLELRGLQALVLLDLLPRGVHPASLAWPSPELSARSAFGRRAAAAAALGLGGWLWS